MHCYSVFYEVPDRNAWVSDDRRDRYIVNGLYLETCKGTPPPFPGCEPERPPPPPKPPFKARRGFWTWLADLLRF